MLVITNIVININIIIIYDIIILIIIIIIILFKYFKYFNICYLKPFLMHFLYDFHDIDKI